MSEKVILTKEQAEAIETKKGTTGSAAVAKHLEGWTWPENKCLNDLSMEQFVKALYIGYEVEETFEVGDWIYSKQVEKIIQINDEGSLAGYNTFPTYYRHATPEEIAEEKQRRWWRKHGRGVWELRKGDVISDDDGEFHEVSNNNENEDGVSTMSGGFNQTYLEKYSKVICFAEDRKDIDGGDIE